MNHFLCIFHSCQPKRYLMSFDDILKKAKTDITTYGWSFMYVDTNQEQGIESFSYTIGFEKTYNHPEIITFGLPAEPAHGILSATAAAIKDGEKMPLHEPIENILGGDLKVMFKPLDHNCYKDYLSVAIEAYQTTRFRTQVMLWPDKEGKFPTENEYSILVQRHALKVISASEDFDISALEKDKHLH